MTKLIVFAVFIITTSALAFFFRPVSFSATPMPYQEAKIFLNNYLKDGSEWNQSKIEKAEAVILKDETDEEFRYYLLTQLRQVKLVTYAEKVNVFKSLKDKEKMVEELGNMSSTGYIPPLDRSDRVFESVRPEILRFIEEQDDKHLLMPIAVSAQNVLNDKDEWQLILNGLKDCEYNPRCLLILDMTFNTPKRIKKSLEMQKSGAYN